MNNRLTKPKEIKDFKTPSKEKSENGNVKSEKNKSMILSWSREKDSSWVKIKEPKCLRISESK